MPRRIAILDLGTNTFHLLIVEIGDDRSLKVLCREEEFVQLGENGIHEIGQEPFRRGLQQIRQYKKQMDVWQPQQVMAFGTAAIRNASNGDAFIEAVKDICPMEVYKITGDEEAELIYLGVRQAVQLPKEPVLIMDIGGGSTEFIIATDSEICWKQSFAAGASLLRKQFHHHEPIHTSEISQLTHHLDQLLQPLLQQRTSFDISCLVGASGSFDTFADMLMQQHGFLTGAGGEASSAFSPDQFRVMYQHLLQKNVEERLQINGMKSFRAGMIVVAAVLTDYILKQFNIKRIMHSPDALKEGVLWKLTAE